MGGGEVRLAAGEFVIEGLRIPSGVRLIGAGRGRTILRLAPNARLPALANARGREGDGDIVLRDLTVDGAAEQQSRTLSGVLMDNVVDSAFDIEVRNCRGTGLLVSGGGRNRFGSGMFAHGNGRAVAGYGLYIFGSSDNLVEGGRYDDNCIGLAIEASRVGVRARRNRVVEPLCRANRADHGQSGAGVHFEQTEGGDCDGCVLIRPVCSGSTGVGVNNTGCALVIDGGTCVDNRETGIVTIAARGIRYAGLTCSGNARGRSNGYRAEMRFDDSGLRPGTTGTVFDCVLRGTAPDGGVRTMSPHSALLFARNRVEGYRFPYILSGRGDRVDRG